MRFSITVSITLLFTVFGFYGTPVHADEISPAIQDINISNRIDNVHVEDVSKDFRIRDVTEEIRIRSLGEINDPERNNRTSSFAHVIGGDEDDEAFYITKTSDGGFVVAGDSASYGIAEWGHQNIMLMKFNSQGVLLWARTVEQSTGLRVTDVATTSGNDILVTGDSYIIKFSGIGDWIWSKRISVENITSIAASFDNGCFVTGDENHNYNVPFIMKLDENGAVSWAKKLVNIYGYEGDWGSGIDVQQCSDGGCLVAVYYTEDGDYLPLEMFVQKYSSTGYQEWSKRISDCGEEMSFHSIKQTSDGGFVLTGSCGDQLMIIKADSAGDKEWSKYLEDPEFALYGVCVDQCANDWFVVCGGSRVYRFHSSGIFLDGRISDGGGETIRRFYSIHETADLGYVMVGTIMDSGTYVKNMLVIRTNSNLYVPGCDILQSLSLVAFDLSNGTSNDTILCVTFVAESNDISLTITAPDPDIFDICATPTPTMTPTSTWTPVPPTNTPTPTSAGCSILCLSSDYSQSQVQTGPALVSTGLLSPVDISHLDCETDTPLLADLIPYDAILVWSKNAFHDQTALGDVLTEYVDQGGGLVIAPYAFTREIEGDQVHLSGNILREGYSPFLPITPLLTSGRLASQTVTYPAHPYFVNVNLDNVIYTVDADYSEPTLNTPGDILHARDTFNLNLVAENAMGNIGGVNIYPGYLLEGALMDTRVLVANMLLTVSGCNAPPTATPTPLPTATAVGCSILCLSSDEDNSIPHVEPALVSTGLLSPPDIFHMVVGKNPPDLVDLMPYDAILFWSLEELGDKVGLGEVLKDYVDAGGGVVLATYAFTSDIGMGNIQIAGGILDPGYSPFLPESSQMVAGQMDAGSVDPSHAFFDGVDLENIIYFKSEQFSNPPLNEGGVLLARDLADLNFLAENNDGTVGAVSMFPGEMNHPSTTDDARRLVANMLITVSGCSAVPTVTPIPSSTAIPTDTPIPTDSPTPSATAEPTGTPVPPTDTPVPTDTPTAIPTDTPVPTLTPTQTSTPCIHHGDVTGDGSVTAADAQRTFEIVLELVVPSFVEACAADCNGDGNVTAGDAQQIFGVIFGGACVDPVV